MASRQLHTPVIRLMTPADVAGGCELAAQAGWNQTTEDWTRALALAPDGCMCIEQDARIVATATLVSYGVDLAWVGMVLTHRDYQRRGLARELVRAAVRLGDDKGIRCQKLDATDYGYSLYRELGFIDEQPVERWRREPAPLDAEPCPQAAVDGAMDAEAFGVHRAPLLDALGTAIATRGGYVTNRPGRVARYLGPCIARDDETARRLVRACIAERPGEPWFWDLLPQANPGAVRIASELGFAPVRRLVRMYRGEPVRGNDKLVYAIAGFEFG